MVSCLALGTWKTRSPVLNFVFRELALECMLRDIHVNPRHIPGVENIISDALSRSLVHPEYAWVVDLLDPGKQVVVNLNASYWRQDVCWEEILVSMPRNLAQPTV